MLVIILWLRLHCCVLLCSEIPLHHHLFVSSLVCRWCTSSFVIVSRSCKVTRVKQVNSMQTWTHRCFAEDPVKESTSQWEIEEDEHGMCGMSQKIVKKLKEGQTTKYADKMPRFSLLLCFLFTCCIFRASCVRVCVPAPVLELILSYNSSHNSNSPRVTRSLKLNALNWLPGDNRKG